MAIMDYGVLVCINGKFINKNMGLFQDDEGIIEAAYNYGGKQDIQGNYFAYVGDKDFLLVFYKTYFHVIHDNIILYTFYPNEEQSVVSTVIWGININIKSIGSFNSGKYIATWNYKENEYEIIFGYGIENNQKVYDKIKFKHYRYTKKNRKIIDRWFKYR